MGVASEKILKMDMESSVIYYRCMMDLLSRGIRWTSYLRYHIGMGCEFDERRGFL